MRSASYDNQLIAGRPVVVIEGQIWFIFCSYSAPDSDKQVPELSVSVVAGCHAGCHKKWLI